MERTIRDRQTLCALRSNNPQPRDPSSGGFISLAESWGFCPDPAHRYNAAIEASGSEPAARQPQGPLQGQLHDRGPLPTPKPQTWNELRTRRSIRSQNRGVAWPAVTCIFVAALRCDERQLCEIQLREIWRRVHGAFRKNSAAACVSLAASLADHRQRHYDKLHAGSCCPNESGEIRIEFPHLFAQQCVPGLQVVKRIAAQREGAAGDVVQCVAIQDRDAPDEVG